MSFIRIACIMLITTVCITLSQTNTSTIDQKFNSLKKSFENNELQSLIQRGNISEETGNIIINYSDLWDLTAQKQWLYEFHIPNTSIWAYVSTVNFDELFAGNEITPYLAMNNGKAVVWPNLLYDHKQSEIGDIIILAMNYKDTVMTINGKECLVGFGYLEYTVAFEYVVSINYQYASGTVHKCVFVAGFNEFVNYSEAIYAFLDGITFDHVTDVMFGAKQRTSKIVEVVDNRIRLNLQERDDVTVGLYNVQGKMLHTFYKGEIKGEKVFTLPEDLGSGMTILCIDGDRVHEWRKVIMK